MHSLCHTNAHTYRGWNTLLFICVRANTLIHRCKNIYTHMHVLCARLTKTVEYAARMTMVFPMNNNKKYSLYGDVLYILYRYMKYFGAKTQNTKCFYFTYYSHVPLNNDLCVRIDESMKLEKLSINICVTNFYTSAFFY